MIGKWFGGYVMFKRDWTIFPILLTTPHSIMNTILFIQEINIHAPRIIITKPGDTTALHTCDTEYHKRCTTVTMTKSIFLVAASQYPHALHMSPTCKRRLLPSVGNRIKWTGHLTTCLHGGKINQLNKPFYIGTPSRQMFLLVCFSECLDFQTP